MDKSKWFIVALDNDGERLYQLHTRHSNGGGSSWVNYGKPEKLTFDTKEQAEAMLSQVQCWDLELKAVCE